jgi:cell cycle arrest protein BUB3
LSATFSNPVQIDALPDLISKVTWGPQKHLLVSSWDTKLRLYSVSHDNSRQVTEVSASSPILDCCWGDNGVAFTGGLAGVVEAIDLQAGELLSIGQQHADAISSVVCDAGNNLIVSGSWDKNLQFIDARGGFGNKDSSMMIPTAGKVYTMDKATNSNYVVCGLGNRQIHIYDIRNMGQVFQRRDSSLKFMTRKVRSMPDGKGYANTSIEGRVAVEWFDPSPEVQAQKYAFKCHRAKEPDAQGRIEVHPVNGVAFHPATPAFFTGGSDGVVYCWDGKQRRRLKQYPHMPTSVMGLDVDSTSGDMLAIACADDSFKENPNGALAKSSLHVRFLDGEGL